MTSLRKCKDLFKNITKCKIISVNLSKELRNRLNTLVGPYNLFPTISSIIYHAILHAFLTDPEYREPSSTPLSDFQEGELESLLKRIKAKSS